eukprot:gb/GEZJ01000525.1/.p1 GENE.gb/GEZJ01000525.1/~~gb/GEZJ01000525.1/.p1  ORF type:complete len:1242 (+),score=176.62 gb/GEZJ01000525.1/:959-4684(+)
MSSASSRRSSLTRPLPRLSTASPPPTTVYVVERLGRFHRLLHSSPATSAPLPLFDKVVAAYTTKKVRQSAPHPGIVASLSSRSRVHVLANWTLRLADAKKLAYRVEDVDRCVQLLVAVRVRESTVHLQHAPRSTAQLEQLSEAIRSAVDQTALKFGVRCLSFSILSVTPVDVPRPQPHDSFRSQLSELPLTPSAPLAPAPHVDAVLPEVPMDRYTTPQSLYIPDGIPFHYPQQPSPQMPALQHSHPYMFPVLTALPPMQLEAPTSVNLRALPAPEYGPPVEHTLAPAPALPGVPRPSSYEFRPQFPPLVWPQPPEEHQIRGSSDSLDLPVPVRSTHSSAPLVSQLSTGADGELVEPQARRRAFSEPNIAHDRQLSRPKLPVVPQEAVGQEHATDPNSPVEPRSSSLEPQSSPEATTSTEQPAIGEASREVTTSSVSQGPRQGSVSAASAPVAREVEREAKPTPPTTKARKPLRAPPSSPVLPALLGESDTFSILLSRALGEMLEDPTVECISPDKTLPREPEEFSPNIAKYLNELPPTPAHQVPSSESSDPCDTVAGKPLPLETRIPGLSDQPSTDEGEAGLEEQLDGETARYLEVPNDSVLTLPPVSALGAASIAAAAATAAAVAKLVVVDNHSDDPPSSLDNTVQATEAPLVAPVTEQSREVVPDANLAEVWSDAKEDFIALPDSALGNKIGPAIVSPLAVTPLPPAVGSTADSALLPLNEQVEAEEEEENSSTEAVHDEDLSDLDGGESERKWRSWERNKSPKGTGSLLGSVVGKTERAFRSAGGSLASDIIDGPMRLINARSNTPRIKDSSSASSSKSSRLRFPKVLSPRRERKKAVAKDELEERLARDMGKAGGKRRDEGDQWESMRDGKMQRDRLHGEDTQEWGEQVQRSRLLDELDGISRAPREAIEKQDDDSTDGGSLDMCMDDGSDSERATFDDAALARGEAYSRQKRSSKSSSSPRRRSHRRRDRYESAEYESDSSSECACEDCGHRRARDEEDYGSGRSTRRSRRSKSRSRSRSADYDDEDELESNYSHRSSSSKSRSGGRHRRSSNERELDDRSSSRKDRQRSRKHGSRDKSVDKERSSSKRSRGSESKSSHTRKHSSSRKWSRDIDGEKRHKSSKGRSKRRHEDFVAPSTELYYPHQDARPIKSIYRHRLPYSDSEEENPIPWYCEGQSEAEDTGADEHPRRQLDDGRRGANVNPMKYSSYGSRDRNGRRRRAYHNRSVHFLYDNLRR